MLIDEAHQLTNVVEQKYQAEVSLVELEMVLSKLNSYIIRSSFLNPAHIQALQRVSEEL